MTDPSHLTNETSSLVYEDSFPLRWRPLSEAPTPAELASFQESNEDVLRVLAVLDEHPADLPEDHSEVAAELRRIDFKLNTLMDLVTRLLGRQLDLPPARRARLGATGITWFDPQPPARGALIGMDLYLSRKYPQSLHIFAQVETVEAVPQGEARVQARFEGVSVNLTNWLEKLIFVHHRRQVAHARRAQH